MQNHRGRSVQRGVNKGKKFNFCSGVEKLGRTTGEKKARLEGGRKQRTKYWPIPEHSIWGRGKYYLTESGSDEGRTRKGSGGGREHGRVAMTDLCTINLRVTR